LWLKGFDFQFWQLPDFGNFGDLFPDPHPPIRVLLKTNAKPQFDRAVDRAVEAFFRVFSTLNHVESALSPTVAFN